MKDLVLLVYVDELKKGFSWLAYKALICRVAWLVMKVEMNLLKAEIEAVREEMDRE